MPPIIGYAAASGILDAPAWALFAILFFWQFPHFLAIAWMYREDYERAGIVMLPVVQPDGKSTARHQRRGNGARQSRLVRDAVKRIGQEHEIHRTRYQVCQIIGIAFDEFAVGDRALRKPQASHIKQLTVDIDPNDAAGRLGDLQSEPAIAAAQVDDAHPRPYADRIHHFRRIRPQRLPPAGGRHFGPLEKARELRHLCPSA